MANKIFTALRFVEYHGLDTSEWGVFDGGNLRTLFNGRFDVYVTECLYIYTDRFSVNELIDLSPDYVVLTKDGHGVYVFLLNSPSECR